MAIDPKDVADEHCQMAKKITERLGGWDATISMSERAFDVVSKLWPSGAAAITAAGTTILSHFTGWTKNVGLLGIFLIVILSSLLVYLISVCIRYLQSSRRLRLAEAQAVEHWNMPVDVVNPLEKEFQGKRINILSLCHPVTKNFTSKRFINCELIGPTCIALINSKCTDCGFMHCDTVVIRPDVPVLNGVPFIDCELYKCTIWNCTLFINDDAVQTFKEMNSHFISYTKDDEVNSRKGQTAGRNISDFRGM